MDFATTDLCDQFADRLLFPAPIFTSYGGKASFCGPIATLKVFEDNALVRTTLSTPGAGKVLIVDGGGSLRCALVGDQLAALALQNGWSGVVVNGCIRDSAIVKDIAVGLMALATHPLRSARKAIGEADIPVTFAGVTFKPGAYLYADADGIIVADQNLT